MEYITRNSDFTHIQSIQERFIKFMQIRGGNCNGVNACSIQGKTFILQRWSLVRFLMENQREMKGEGVGIVSYVGPCNYYSNVFIYSIFMIIVISFWYSKASFLCLAF
jgi:hypothetical protein